MYKLFVVTKMSYYSGAGVSCAIDTKVIEFESEQSANQAYRNLSVIENTIAVKLY